MSMKEMNKLYEKSLLTLELPSVLRMLQEEAVCSAAKEAAMELRPTDIAAEAADRLRETTDAKRMVAQKGTAPLCDIRPVSGSLARARLRREDTVPSAISSIPAISVTP